MPPVPPSTFRTTDPITREDLHRIRRYLAELTDWTTEQIEAATGSIESVTAGTGILVTGGTGPTVTIAADFGTGAGQVAAGNNVLLRGANDFSTFSAKTSVAAGDLFLIEDAAASGVKKKVDASALFTAFGFAKTGNPYLDGPTTPDSWDDNFTAVDQTGSADLSTRGWTVYNHSASTAMAYNGDISRTTLPGNAFYNSRIVGSTCFLQLPVNSTVFVIKASSGTYQYLMHLGQLVTNGIGWGGAFMTTATSAPFFTSSHNSGNGPGWLLSYKDTGPNLRFLGRTVNAAAFVDLNSTVRTEDATDIYGISYNSNGASSILYPQFITAANGQMRNQSSAGGATPPQSGWSPGSAPPYAMVGFGMSTFSVSAASTNNWFTLFALHSARRLAHDAWIA